MLAKFLIFIYNIFIIVALPFIYLRLFLRSFKNPGYKKRTLERLGIFKSPKFKESIWVHSVSLGESVAAIPLIKLLMEKYPHTPIVVTTMTPTGSNKIKEALKDSVFHVYVPYDFTFAINNFIKKVKPKALVIMETELWPNILQTCYKKNIKIFLANARLSDKSRRNYQKIPSITKLMMNCLSLVFAQYENDAKNFLSLGLDKSKLIVTGNIKFDITLPSTKVKAGQTIKSKLNNRFVIVAASTHHGEEKIILDVYNTLLKEYPTLLLVIVPRHPERFNEVEKLIKNYNFSCVTRTSNKDITDSTNVFLGNTVGELITFYAMSDIAFVGGSLVPIGGHNLLEPASLKIPTITGSYLHNFKTISELMNEEHAVIIVKENEIGATLTQLINNKKYRESLANNTQKFMAKNNGSLSKTIKSINL